MKLKQLICLLATLMFAETAMAQIYERTPREYDFALSDIAKRIIPVLSFNQNMHNDSWIWKEGRSSALVEKGKPSDFYEINKINDLDMELGENDISTAWVEGVQGDGIGEWVIIPVTVNDDELEDMLNNGKSDGKLDIHFFICNGFQKSQDLYLKNNRIKDAKITIYAAAYSCGQDDAFLLWNPDSIYEQTITLNDEIIFNPICLNFHSETFSVTLPEKYRKEHCELYLKLEIRSVYKGSKYNDTCISDMAATAAAPEEGPDI